MDLGTETHRNENAELDKGRNSKKTPHPPEKKFNQENKQISNDCLKIMRTREQTNEQ